MCRAGTTRVVRRRAQFMSAAIASAWLASIVNPASADSTWSPFWSNTGWSNAAAWIGPVANGVGVGASFQDFSANERNLTIDGNFTVGSLIFSSTQGGSWTFNNNGVNKLTIDAGAGNTAQISTTKTQAIIPAPLILNSGAALTSGSLGSSWIQLMGAISGSGDLIVNAFSRIDITGNNSTWSGGMHLNVGVLNINNSNVLGTAVGATYIDSVELTTLRIGQNLVISDDIYLNNARGMGYAGAIAGKTDNTQLSTITGRVDLGSVGAFIAGGSAISTSGLRLKGQVSGGTLNVVGGVVGIASNNNTFTGALRVQSGTGRVMDNGVVSTAARVIVDGGAELLLDNNGTATLTNRLADSIPITLNGGAVRLVAGNSDVTETIGSVSIALGAGHIQTKQASGAFGHGTLTVNSISRNPGSSFILDDNDALTLNSAVYLSSGTPSLTNGIIGGWAVTDYQSGVSFLSYGPKGLVGFFSNDDVNAGTASNVRVNTSANGVTLASSKTINSIVLDGSIPNRFNLGGNTLTINTGGVASITPIIVENGTIGPGAASNGELHLTGGLDLRANIADGPFGPTSLVKAGRQDTALSGTNTFSGAIYINERQLAINGPQAMPANQNPVNCDGGTFALNYSGTTTVELGALKIRSNGGASGLPGAPRIQPTSILAESGSLGLRLAGSAAFTKDTDGIFTMFGDNAQYSGSILIEEGLFIAGNGVNNATNPVTVLGTGITTVSAGATLVHNVNTGPLEGHIVLNGGALGPAGGNEFAADVNVVADSKIYTVSPLATTFNIPVVVTFLGTFTIVDGVQLTTIGNGTLNFAGFNNAGAIKLQNGIATGGPINGIGSIAVTQGASLRAAYVNQGALSVQDNAVATITLNGTSAGLSKLGQISITSKGTLDLSNNDMQLTGGGGATYGQIAGLIATARHGGAWDQAGLTSSAARDANPHNTTLATITGSQFLSTDQTAFDGSTVQAGDLLVKYTYYGDTDLNGVVNFDDYSRTDSGFNTAGTDWFHGDFDYNGIVNFDDYSLIDLAFNTQSGTLRRAMSYLDGGDRSDSGMNAPALQFVQQHFARFGNDYAQSFLASVPEPASVSIACALGMMLLATRRRRSGTSR